MYSEDLKKIIVATGGKVNDLPDNLRSTLMQRLCETMGIDTSDMDDNLMSSYVEQIYTEYSGGGGSAEIPTCTVRFVSSENVYYDYCHAYSKLEDGNIVAVSIDEGDMTDAFDITFENVVCGSIMYFNWGYYEGDAYADVDGTAIQISNGAATNESSLFIAPTVAGEVCTITIGAWAWAGDDW